MIAKIIVAIDNFLYKRIGIVTPIRRVFWCRQSIKIQKELDYQHGKRDYLNRVNGTNMTTHDALVYLDKLYEK